MASFKVFIPTPVLLSSKNANISMADLVQDSECVKNRSTKTFECLLRVGFNQTKFYNLIIQACYHQTVSSDRC